MHSAQEHTAAPLGEVHTSAYINECSTLEQTLGYCNIPMFILRNKKMYFGDFVVLVHYISNKFMIIT